MMNRFITIENIHVMYSTFSVQHYIDFTEEAGDTKDPSEKPASTLGSDFTCFDTGANKKDM